MKQNIKVAKELLKLAKNLIALDEEGDGSGFQGLHDYDNVQKNRLIQHRNKERNIYFTIKIMVYGEFKLVKILILLKKVISVV